MAQEANLEQATAEEQSTKGETDASYYDYDGPPLGTYASWNAGEDFVDCSQDIRNQIMEIVTMVSRTDVAARRFEVEQCWQLRLFVRGYQHLYPGKNGGWELPGQSSRWGIQSTMDLQGMYATNIFSRDSDIIVGALAREVPEVEFFPMDPNSPEDTSAAEAAKGFKEIFDKNNNLRLRANETAQMFFTDDRVIAYTRYVIDGQKFGFDKEGIPEGREIVTIYGKLEGKVPIGVNEERDMHFAQIYQEIDVALARARYPWAADRITAGSCGIGEVELDKIARVNSKLALLGTYVTGDAMVREVTEQYTWLRPAIFFDPSIDEQTRKELLEMFPSGCLVIACGREFVGVRPESFDDHLKVTHAVPGFGQNRRALGSNTLPIQQRINNWVSLLDDFFRRTVPKVLAEANTFDIAQMKKQNNTPGGVIGFQLPAGVTSLQQVIGQEPMPTHQPALPETIKYFVGELDEGLSGAVPAIYGSAVETPDTMGGAMIQRDMALQRLGISWNMLKDMFAEIFRQAVVCAAKHRNGVISHPSSKIVVDPQDLKGNILCYPEYDAAFPETWNQREFRFTELVANAPTNPYYAKLLDVPSNKRAIADNIRMSALTIPGEASVRKQQAEIEVMLNAAPVDNPALEEGKAKLDEIKSGMAADITAGKPIPPEAEPMLQQVQQHLGALPPMISTVPVAQDESEDHVTEAATCFEWMNSTEGLRAKEDPEFSEGWENVHLHWQEHTAMAKKLASANVPPAVPKASVSIPLDKMPPELQSQLAQEAGFAVSPQVFKQHNQQQVRNKLAEKVIQHPVKKLRPGR